ncbi:MAG: aminotransferase class III-fold pyridoxal phosphate-dependent enzyme, partial [Pseudomonadota bacterium]
AYNNVPHVGHCHPAVVRAATAQMRRLNTNTRYLHDAALAYADRLTALMPDELSVCFFVNSASEANELALRLARAHTQARDTLVMEHGYHGNTTGALDISPYKFRHLDGPPPWVHVTPQPDVYRGEYRGADAGARYAARVSECLQTLAANGRRPAAYVCEAVPSVGGQIVLPDGFLARVYDAVRAAGAVCICDDVQTGLGRLGVSLWGFEPGGVVPDIVVLGKPLGNGHPLAAVVTRPAIAESFGAQVEFFSTFGGNTVSCAVGLAVLDVLAEEDLVAGARRTGERLSQGLRELMADHALIGDVRGMGLFLGVELVTDRDARTPATRQATYVKNRLRERRVLIGSEGPHDNVLKIRPPMSFDGAAADALLERLAGVLREDCAQPDAVS